MSGGKMKTAIELLLYAAGAFCMGFTIRIVGSLFYGSFLG